MKSLKTSLIATLIATGAGWGVWEFGVAQKMWPAHPQMADFLFTVVTAIVLQIAWPRLMSERANRG
jgi:hypothetical protein